MLKERAEKERQLWKRGRERKSEEPRKRKIEKDLKKTTWGKEREIWAIGRYLEGREWSGERVRDLRKEQPGERQRDWE